MSTRTHRFVVLLATLACTLAALAPNATAGGAAFVWHGQANTDLNFSEFFSTNHTIMSRFMLQYPLGPRGPIFGVQSPRCAACPTGTSYSIGLGSYGEQASTGTNLVLEVAGQVRRYSVAIPAGTWQHLAVSHATNFVSVFKLYLNGKHVCADAPDPCDLATLVPPAPNGTLALGRTDVSTTGSLPAALDQFYGLLDDVAIYKAALTEQQILSLASMGHVVSGLEPNLYAGYPFEVAAQNPPLNRPVSFAGGAFWNPFVGGAGAGNQNPNTYDSKLLPTAQAKYAIKLPLQQGDEWKVKWGYASTLSHYGAGAFSLDLARSDPAATIGSTVRLPLSGTVKVATDHWDETGPNACTKSVDPVTMQVEKSNCNRVDVEVEPGFVLSFLHLKKNSVPWAVGDFVIAGAKIGEDGDHPNGAHLHFSAGVTDKDSNQPNVTFPVVFKNYQVKSGNSWQNEQFGIPQQGDVIRIP